MMVNAHGHAKQVAPHASRSDDPFRVLHPALSRQRGGLADGPAGCNVFSQSVDTGSFHHPGKAAAGSLGYPA